MADDTSTWTTIDTSNYVCNTLVPRKNILRCFGHFISQQGSAHFSMSWVCNKCQDFRHLRALFSYIQYIHAHIHRYEAMTSMPNSLLHSNDQAAVSWQNIHANHRSIVYWCTWTWNFSTGNAEIITVQLLIRYFFSLTVANFHGPFASKYVYWWWKPTICFSPV